MVKHHFFKWLLESWKSGEKLNIIGLSPYDANAFFIMTENGEVLHSISGSPAAKSGMCATSPGLSRNGQRRLCRRLYYGVLL